VLRLLLLWLLLLLLRLGLRPLLRVLTLSVATRTCAVGIILKRGVRGSWWSCCSNHDCPLFIRISLGRSSLLARTAPRTRAQACIRRRWACVQGDTLEVTFEHLRGMFVDTIDSVMTEGITILLLPDLIVSALGRLGR